MFAVLLIPRDTNADAAKIKNPNGRLALGISFDLESIALILSGCLRVRVLRRKPIVSISTKLFVVAASSLTFCYVESDLSS